MVSPNSATMDNQEDTKHLPDLSDLSLTEITPPAGSDE